MTEHEPYDPARDGWRLLREAPLPGSLATPWAKNTEAGWRYGLATTSALAKPRNRLAGTRLCCRARSTATPDSTSKDLPAR